MRELESLIFQHRAAWRTFSRRMDERNAALKEWAKAKTNASPDLPKAKVDLNRANEAFEAARKGLADLDAQINEERKQQALGAVSQSVVAKV